MGVIDPELVRFKAQVSPAIGSMNAACSSITNGIKELSSSANSVQSCVENSYDSANKSSVLSNLGRVNEIYNKIVTSIESDLTSFISGAENVISKVEYLDTINAEIAEQQNIINNNQGEEKEQVAAVLAASNIITQKNELFNTKHEEAKKALSALKAMDGSVSFCQEFSTSNYESLKGSLEYGTFEQRTFTSSTGETIDYCIYIPDYKKEVDKLPCLLYLHGSTSSYSDPGWSKYGLTGLIKNQDITPSGIVIMPHIKDHKDTQTLKELTDYVVSEYNCDTDKISISGHSSGAIATYRMINTYPDYFSCAVPISGSNLGSINEEAFGNMKVWAFGGSEEGGDGATSTTIGQYAVNNVNSVGGKGRLTVLGCGHAATDERTFEKEYESPDGTKEYVIEWMFEQTKA